MEDKLKQLKDILDQSSENEVRTESMVVSKNVLKLPHTTIQLSSISKIYVGKIETKVKIPFVAIGIAIISLFIIKFNIAIGIVALCLSSWYIYTVFKNVPDDQIFLNLLLNSGTTCSIFFSDYNFAERVRSVIEEAFNGVINNTQKIDMIEKNIYDIAGNNNTVNFNNLSVSNDNSINNSGNNNSGNSSIGHQHNSSIIQVLNNELDWNMIQTELAKVVSAIQDSSSSVKLASEEALKLAERGETTSFITFIKENKKDFSSSIFKAVASGVLVETFAKLIS
ncbi:MULTISPECIES: hypothetical protein [unclassified Enterococcus]|uniref:hypothetical protein n=1 Tax=unclassified Enterococcus TaxID=2608891 RepID=UPI001552E1CC|nr:MULTISPECIES: hypothetical protein [unclassified Enterococcus]MBS7576980.1 hypothetical protein [Enterococcus sp. MMGLQ5-2]MBS7584573.1 hypothetical protein [Enterococcus sp. MMGLQ5-1]NPD12428.1 hypothetical protein [Enterococcus sp. MMGLQ5-1]NPD36814.1 hypothetical protein [Enterococcus sp. MMGLQ5-2]